jgi:hypothetical protein
MSRNLKDSIVKVTHAVMSTTHLSPDKPTRVESSTHHSLRDLHALEVEWSRQQRGFRITEWPLATSTEFVERR